MRIKGYTAELINHTFQILLVTYLVLLLIEQVWPGVVSIYLNLNYFLVFVIITGILDVFSEHEKKTEKKAGWKDYGFVFVLGVLGFWIIKYKTFELGWLSWVISIIAGILIVLLSVLVLEENGENDK